MLGRQLRPRLLTRPSWTALADMDELADACRRREAATGRGWRHFHSALVCAHTVLFHLDVVAEPPPPAQEPDLLKPGPDNRYPAPAHLGQRQEAPPQTFGKPSRSGGACGGLGIDMSVKT